MLSNSQRIFVGNIPPGVTENDLRNEFSAYGNVNHVDLKSKENLVDPANPNWFAFITLDISNDMINRCIDEFSREQYRGRYLNVSVARESFLDRLKREREEASKKKPTITEEKPIAKVNGISPAIPTIKSTKSSSSSSSSSESEESSSESEEDEPNQKKPIEDPTVFITKKNASTSLQNGKIKIQSVSSAPLHVISKKQKEVKRLDDKAKNADQKRKESLNKMKNQYNQQKLAIQQALSSVDSGKSKKIIFDSEETSKNDTTVETKKTNLFDDDDEDNEDYNKDFEIKTQFQGKEGEQLMKLQSKFKLDPRFAMDSRFLDGENKVQEETEQDNDERKWQLGLIEKVVGRKLESVPEPNKKKLHNTMQRFDPTKDDHKKKPTGETDEDDTTNKKIGKAYNEEVEVSKEQSYNVSEDLSKSLNRRGEGFSLLSMFGRTETPNENNNQEIEYKEKTISDKNPEKILSNPFEFDSSDSEVDGDGEVDIEVKAKVEETPKPVGKSMTKSGIWKENFFIFGDDPRLKDGSEFFEAKKLGEDETPKDYVEVKKKLRQIIHRKIIQKRKNAEGFKVKASKFRKTK